MNLIKFEYNIYNNARKILKKYTNKTIANLFPEKSDLNFIDGDVHYMRNLFIWELSNSAKNKN